MSGGAGFEGGSEREVSEGGWCFEWSIREGQAGEIERARERESENGATEPGRELLASGFGFDFSAFFSFRLSSSCSSLPLPLVLTASWNRFAVDVRSVGTVPDTARRDAEYGRTGAGWNDGMDG